MAPSLAAEPYSFFYGNENYLCQLMILGVGRYRPHQIYMGDLLAWDEDTGDTGKLADLNLQFLEPGEQVTLFRPNVFTSSEVTGQELRNFSTTITAQFISNELRMTSPSPTPDSNLSGVRTGDKFVISGSQNAGEYLSSGINVGVDTITVARGVFPFQGTESATITLDNTVGPFVVCRPGRVVNRVEVDFVFANGIYLAEDDGTLSSQTIAVTVDAREIDDLGNPVGDGLFSVLGNHSYSGSTRTAQRYTEGYDISSKRVEVRVTRTTVKSLNQRSMTTMNWVGLKGYVPHSDTFPDVSLVAVKLRATDLTAQATRSFTVVQTALTPVWDGSEFSEPVETQSIAWAAADLLRNPVYGLGMADSEIDLPKLKVLERTWQLRGDTLNCVFDTPRTADDALSLILSAGRASYQRVGGIITFVRDEPRTLAKGSFTPRNIKAGTFQTDHILVDDKPLDDVIVTFRNEAKSWKEDEVQCTLPGSSSSNPARISIFGVTNLEHARREGFYRAAANRYGRILASLSTDMEGHLLLRGDPVLVSHDFIRGYGQSGEVVSVSGLRLTLSEDLDWTESGNKYIALSMLDNTAWGPVKVSRGDSDRKIIIDQYDYASLRVRQPAIEDFIVTQSDGDAATRFHFGTIDSYAKRYRIAAVTPSAIDDIRIGLVREDDRIYAADGAYNPTIPPSHSMDFSKRKNSGYIAAL